MCAANSDTTFGVAKADMFIPFYFRAGRTLFPRSPYRGVLENRRHLEYSFWKQGVSRGRSSDGRHIDAEGTAPGLGAEFVSAGCLLALTTLPPAVADGNRAISFSTGCRRRRLWKTLSFILPYGITIRERCEPGQTVALPYGRGSSVVGHASACPPAKRQVLTALRAALRANQNRDH